MATKPQASSCDVYLAQALPETPDIHRQVGRSPYYIKLAREATYAEAYDSWKHGRLIDIIMIVAGIIISIIGIVLLFTAKDQKLLAWIVTIVGFVALIWGFYHRWVDRSKAKKSTWYNYLWNESPWKDKVDKSIPVQNCPPASWTGIKP